MMATLGDRSRVSVIKPDGSLGATFLCITVSQRTLVCLVLAASGLSYKVEQL